MNITTSYSLCNAWKNGNIETVELMLQGLPTFKNEAMDRGTYIHKRVAEEKTRLMSYVDNTTIFENPKTEEIGEGEMQFSIKLTPEITYTGSIDAYTPGQKTIIDWKATINAIGKSNPMQLYCYAYALRLLGKSVNWGVIAKVEEKEKVLSCPEYFVIKITEDKINEGKMFILDNTKNIINYILNKKNED
jgi:hypothetical protein